MRQKNALLRPFFNTLPCPFFKILCKIIKKIYKIIKVFACILLKPVILIELLCKIIKKINKKLYMQIKIFACLLLNPDILTELLCKNLLVFLLNYQSGILPDSSNSFFINL